MGPCHCPSGLLLVIDDRPPLPSLLRCLNGRKRRRHCRLGSRQHSRPWLQQIDRSPAPGRQAGREGEAGSRLTRCNLLIPLSHPITFQATQPVLSSPRRQAAWHGAKLVPSRSRFILGRKTRPEGLPATPPFTHTHTHIPAQPIITPPSVASPVSATSPPPTRRERPFPLCRLRGERQPKRGRGGEARPGPASAKKERAAAAAAKPLAALPRGLPPPASRPRPSP